MAEAGPSTTSSPVVTERPMLQKIEQPGRTTPCEKNKRRTRTAPVSRHPLSIITSPNADHSNLFRRAPLIRPSRLSTTQHGCLLFCTLSSRPFCMLQIAAALLLLTVWNDIKRARQRTRSGTQQRALHFFRTHVRPRACMHAHMHICTYATTYFPRLRFAKAPLFLLGPRSDTLVAPRLRPLYFRPRYFLSFSTS